MDGYGGLGTLVVGIAGVLLTAVPAITATWLLLRRRPGWRDSIVIAAHSLTIVMLAIIAVLLWLDYPSDDLALLVTALAASFVAALVAWRRGSGGPAVFVGSVTAVVFGMFAGTSASFGLFDPIREAWVVVLAGASAVVAFAGRPGRPLSVAERKAARMRELLGPSQR